MERFAVRVSSCAHSEVHRRQLLCRRRFCHPCAPAGFAARFTNNVQMYSLGASGANVGGFQTNPAAAATDGNPPIPANYDTAYEIADKIDLFNLMVLPPVTNPAVPITSVYANASVFCRAPRVPAHGPPAHWTDRADGDSQG